MAVVNGSAAANHYHNIAAVAAAEAVVHFAITPDGLNRATYLGALYALGAALSVVLAGAAVRQRPWADPAAIVLGAAFGLGYVMSRTAGLPGVVRPDWTLATASVLLLDAALVGLGARAAAKRPAGQTAFAVSRAAMSTGSQSGENGGA